VVLGFGGIEPALRLGKRVKVLRNTGLIELAQALLQSFKGFAITRTLLSTIR
jgi:hypothetical protein